jgi:hypothetical protein
MKKTYLILTAVLLLLLAPQASAWGHTTHKAVARAAYEELPENVRIHLIYTRIEYGSTLPDTDRQTYPDHAQPGSRAQAAYWLTEAGSRYRKNDFDGASLALGIAAHYIADSMCLVHNVPYNPEKHYLYESQGAYLIPAKPAAIPNFNLEQKLTEYHNGASEKYRSWLSGQDPSIVQEGVDLAASYTYNAWCQTLGAPLPEAQGASSFVDFRLIAGVALVILIVIIAVGAKRFYREY